MPEFSVNHNNVWSKIIAVVGLIAACLGVGVLFQQDSPLTLSITAIGLCLLPLATIHPWWGFIVFLWTIHTIDCLKRLVYTVTDLTPETVAQILILPLFVMMGIYVRILLLGWFYRGERPRVEYRKFILLALAGAAGVGLMLRGGFSLETIKQNYPLVFFIPAGIAVPYLLYNEKHQIQFAKCIAVILFVEGIYGIIQAFFGPFKFEIDYMLSGLTSTIGLFEGMEHFRAFSLLNASSTFAGFMAIGSFYTIAFLCRKEGEIVWKRRVWALIIFTAAVCFISTQRGALCCFLITLFIIPIFSRPNLFIGASLAGLFIYSQIIINALKLKEWMYAANEFLASYAHGSLMEQNAGILTLGQRLDGFADMSNPQLWTAFGVLDSAADRNETGAHDLVSQLLQWFGVVGLSIFSALVISMMYIAVKQMSKLRPGTWIYLWSQVNLAIFLFILIWGLLLGSSIHVTPINFYFWISIGNLIFIHQAMGRNGGKEASSLSTPAEQARRRRSHQLPLRSARPAPLSPVRTDRR